MLQSYRLYLDTFLGKYMTGQRVGYIRVSTTSPRRGAARSRRLVEHRPGSGDPGRALRHGHRLRPLEGVFPALRHGPHRRLVSVHSRLSGARGRLRTGDPGTNTPAGSRSAPALAPAARGGAAVPDRAVEPPRPFSATGEPVAQAAGGRGAA